MAALKMRVADDTWDKRTHDTPAGGGKAAALDALRAVAPAEVKPALVQALKSKNPDVRKWAVARLAAEGNK